MAHVISQSQAQICAMLDDVGDNEETSGKGGSESLSQCYGKKSPVSMEPVTLFDHGSLWTNNSSSDVGSEDVNLEDTSCAVKKKNRDNRACNRKEGVRDGGGRSECGGTKGSDAQGSAVSCVSSELEQASSVSSYSADTMERVDTDICDRSRSPYLCPSNKWEASDHSDSNIDHSDSSDDDNPTSQVDRLIEQNASLIMDGENSNLSSESEDTDGDFDSDSDITDVSPLVSNASSPLGLSPVTSRRNLPSSIANRPPFIRHYSHRGHDGDVEDEGDEENVFKQWAQDDLYFQRENTSFEQNCPKMSYVVEALLKMSFDSQNQQNNDENCTQEHTGHTNSSKHKHQLSPSLSANPHHRHLRKSNNSRRKNMTFTNNEVRTINSNNATLLNNIIKVNNREIKTPKENSHPPSSYINRKRQEEEIRKDNLTLLRRLQEVKPSRSIVFSSRNYSSSNSYSSSHNNHQRQHHHKPHHHTYHHHHNSHHSSSYYGNNNHHHSNNSAKSCSATAMKATSAFSPAHHSPKETAL